MTDPSVADDGLAFVPALPAEAPLVIVGAGIVGASIAYHLALRGWRDVVVVDQGPIPATGGSTSHAPGGVFVTNYSRAMTRLALETVELYNAVDLDGLPCFYPVGTLEVARTKERWEDHKRKLGAAAAWGVPGARIISAEEAAELIPILDPREVFGAYHVPIDGIGKPVRAVAALLRRAAATGGAQLIPETKVTGFDVVAGELRGVITDRGVIRTPQAVVAGGIWGPLLGEMLGVPIPLTPCEHLYAITTPVAELTAAGAADGPEVVHPMLRDQDRAMYYRQHGDRYGVGSYQHPPLLVDSKDIRRHGTPAPAGVPGVNPHGERHDMPSLTPWTPEHFEAGWTDAKRLLPSLAGTDLDLRLNGMFSFTPDGLPVLGPAPSARGAWIAEAIWVTHAGGVGRVVADWITDGDPEFDVHEMDIDRFEPVQKTRAYVRARGACNYDEVYDLVHPVQPLGVARPLRTPPFYEALVELGAHFFEGKGFERAQWFDVNRPDPSALRSGWAGQFWSASAATEHKATRDGVAIFDLTSLTRVSVVGLNAASFLDSVTTNVIGPVGSTVYTAICNRFGGLRGDVTITRIAADRFQVGANSAADAAYLRRVARPDERVWIEDITAGTTAVLVTGPHARALLASLSPDDLSNEAFPYLSARPIEVDDVPVLAQRISYAGELGWELYAEAAIGRRLWDVIWRAGMPLGIVAAGRSAYDGLRMEKGYRSYGLDMTEEDDPFEAGIGFTVRLKSKGDFIGREALEAKKTAGLSRKLMWVGLDDPAHVVLGKEPVLSADEVVGYVRSAAYGYNVGRCLTSVMLPIELTEPGTKLTIEWFGDRLPATVVKEPIWDPDGDRLRA